MQKAEVGKSKATRSGEELLARSRYISISGCLKQYSSILAAYSSPCHWNSANQGVRQRFLLDIKTISGQTRRPAERKCKRGRERERNRNRNRKRERETEKKKKAYCSTVAVRMGDFGSKLLFSPCLYLILFVQLTTVDFKQVGEASERFGTNMSLWLSQLIVG